MKHHLVLPARGDDQIDCILITLTPEFVNDLEKAVSAALRLNNKVPDFVNLDVRGYGEWTVHDDLQEQGVITEEQATALELGKVPYLLFRVVKDYDSDLRTEVDEVRIFGDGDMVWRADIKHSDTRIESYILTKAAFDRIKQAIRSAVP